MNKEKMREKYKQTRDNIKDREKISEQIINRVLVMPEYINANIIGIYNNFGSEVDTSKIIEHALENGKTVGLPVIIEENMEFYSINTTQDVQNKNSMGIGEPIKSAESYLEPKSFDLIIVPGICFDLENNRLGFGKGYYDRYLSNKGLTAVKVGICFREQVSQNEIINVDAYDVKMDRVVFNE